MATGTATVLTDARVFVGGYDLSGQANQVASGAAVTMADVTSFGSAGWAEARPGIISSRLDVTTYQDDATVGTGLAAGTTGLVVSVCDDDAEFATGWGFSAVTLGDVREMQVGEVYKSQLSLAGTGSMFQGELLLPRTVDTNGGTGSIRQLGAVAADERVYANLHVFAVSGGGVTVTVQSAALVGFGSPTSRISFSAASAVGSQTSSTAGAITDQFWRVSWTQTATSATFAVLVGIQ
jgi:hypothetical protein